MQKTQTAQTFKAIQTPLLTVKKLLLSSFVVATFTVYAVHERLDGAAISNVIIPPALSSKTNQSRPGSNPPVAVAQVVPSATPTAMPSATPTDVPTTIPTATGYQDGQFTGDSADAFYGMVQVKTIIQGGKITDVQFVDYPHDRRTSQEINNQAMPWLKQETIQAQNAQVDLISGATLTSQAFIQSLQSSLDKATAASPQSSQPGQSSVPAVPGGYKDGQYTGQTADAYYGLVQVKAIVKSGKITDVQFLNYPHDRRTSQEINNQAMPWLKQEAIQVQNAQVDLISGATLTSQAFVQSLQSALSQAKS